MYALKYHQLSRPFISNLYDRYLKIELDLFLSPAHNLNRLLYLPPRK